MFGLKSRQLFFIVFSVALVYVATQFIAVYYQSFQFSDFVLQEVKFAASKRKSTEKIRASIADEAISLDIPVKPRDIHITKRGPTFSVEIDYVLIVDFEFINTDGISMSLPPDRYSKMIAIERGVEIVLELASQLARPDRMPAETVPLTEAMHRILREDIAADSDSPRFDKAIRDGFAVHSEGLTEVPAELQIVGESRAGHSAANGTMVTPATCCEIMTGAAMPAGANAVVMVEHTERLASDRVRILRGVGEGEGLLRQGVEMREGDPLLRSGKKILLADIGTLASVGKAMVSVSKRPRVAILATGDELVEVREKPDSSRIRNSNSYSLHAQVTEAGAEPVMVGIAQDNLSDLREKIRLGLQHDVLLVSGGVSMGKYDFVEEVFSEFGVKVLFDQVAMKPGKPTVFGHHDETYVFGLPGNPVSTLVAFRMFVRPLLLNLLKTKDFGTVDLEAQLEVATKRDALRTAVVPAVVRFADRGYRIRTAPWKGSSDLAGLSRANALVVIPQGDGMIEAGEWVEFIELE